MTSFHPKLTSADGNCQQTQHARSVTTRALKNMLCLPVLQRWHKEDLGGFLKAYSERWLTGWKWKERRTEDVTFNFVKPGEADKPQPTKNTSILDGITGWNLVVDIGKKLVFPGIVQTNLRPDIILGSETVTKLIMIELTVPWETRCEEAYQRKKAKYTELLKAKYTDPEAIDLHIVRRWDHSLSINMDTCKARNIYDGEHHADDGGRWAEHWPQQSDSSCVSGRRYSWVCTTDLGKLVRGKSSTDAGKQEQWLAGCFTHIRW